MSPHRSVPELRERKFMDHHCVQGIRNFAVPKAPVFCGMVFVNYNKVTYTAVYESGNNKTKRQTKK